MSEVSHEIEGQTNSDAVIQTKMEVNYLIQFYLKWMRVQIFSCFFPINVCPIS